MFDISSGIYALTIVSIQLVKLARVSGYKSEVLSNLDDSLSIKQKYDVICSRLRSKGLVFSIVPTEVHTVSIINFLSGQLSPIINHYYGQLERNSRSRKILSITERIR